MQNSCEIRWFINPDRQSDIRILTDWFQSKAHSSFPAMDAATARTDYYYLLPSDNIGIKVRENTRLELKSLTAKSGNNTIPAGIGTITNWTKFSFDLVQASTKDDKPANFLAKFIAAFTAGDAHYDEYKKYWVKIIKDRLQVKYDASANELVNEKAKPKEGCGIEFTRLRINGNIVFSFGLEAFSSQNKQQEHLISAWHYIKNLHSQLSLTNTDCMDYPAFLRHIAAPALR